MFQTPSRFALSILKSDHQLSSLTFAIIMIIKKIIVNDKITENIRNFAIIYKYFSSLYYFENTRNNNNKMNCYEEHTK